MSDADDNKKEKDDDDEPDADFFASPSKESTPTAALATDAPAADAPAADAPATDVPTADAAAADAPATDEPAADASTAPAAGGGDGVSKGKPRRFLSMFSSKKEKSKTDHLDYDDEEDEGENDADFFATPDDEEETKDVGATGYGPDGSLKEQKKSKSRLSSLFSTKKSTPVDPLDAAAADAAADAAVDAAADAAVDAATASTNQGDDKGVGGVDKGVGGVDKGVGGVDKGVGGVDKGGGAAALPANPTTDVGQHKKSSVFSLFHKKHADTSHMPSLDDNGAMFQHDGRSVDPASAATIVPATHSERMPWMPTPSGGAPLVAQYNTYPMPAATAPPPPAPPPPAYSPPAYTPPYAPSYPPSYPPMYAPPYSPPQSMPPSVPPHQSPHAPTSFPFAPHPATPHHATHDPHPSTKDGLTLRLAALGTSERATSSSPPHDRVSATTSPRGRHDADLAALLLRIAEQFRRLRVSSVMEP